MVLDPLHTAVESLHTLVHLVESSFHAIEASIDSDEVFLYVRHVALKTIEATDDYVVPFRQRCDLAGQMFEHCAQTGVLFVAQMHLSMLMNSRGGVKANCVRSASARLHICEFEVTDGIRQR